MNEMGNSQQWLAPGSAHSMGHGGPSAAQQHGYSMPVRHWQEPSDSLMTQQQPHSAWSQAHRGAGLTELLHGAPSDPAEAVQLGLSAQNSGQGNLDIPLRESAQLESLLQVNSRVEAAMDRARAQLQVSTLGFL